MRKQQIAVGEVGVGVEGDRGDGELPLHGATVERLDVGELVSERDPLGVDASLGERVEHEGIVGIRAVGDGDRLGRHAGIL